MFKLVLLLCAIFCSFGSVIPRFPPTLDNRIVGGENTTIEEFPWQVSYRIRGYHQCGGAIISEDTVLTAAHCFGFISGDVSVLSINAGQTNHRLDGQVIPVSRFILHPQYCRNPSFPYNPIFDIAVLKLASPLQWSAAVQPIALPAAGAQLDDGQLVTTTGWGALKQGESGSDILQKVTVPVIERNRCNQGNDWYKGNITPQMFCAGFREGGKDACQGDSGGPVVANGELVGLVSWGKGCAQPTLPGVYTQVSEFNDWIAQQ